MEVVSETPGGPIEKDVASIAFKAYWGSDQTILL